MTNENKKQPAIKKCPHEYTAVLYRLNDGAGTVRKVCMACLENWLEKEGRRIPT